MAVMGDPRPIRLLAGSVTAYPVLDGWIEGSTVKVWCPECSRWHTHGYDPSFEEGEHRAAHCPRGRYREDGGYQIHIAGNWSELPPDGRRNLNGHHQDAPDGERGRHARPPAAESDDLDALAEVAASFTPVDWAEAWDAAPDDIQWLIEPLIEAGQSVALYAVPGTGKSLIALECAAALATGRPVLGNPPRDPVTVVYIDVENRQPSLVERLQAFGYKPADLSRLILYSFPSIAMLDSFAGGMQVLALAVTAGAAIVIIDTTSRVVAGKENDADTYLAFYRHTVVPLRARGIAMLRLDHPGKDVSRGTRGSSAKKGDVDAEWLLCQTSGTTFELERQKERENHGEAQLSLRRRFEPLRHEITSGTGDRAGEIAGHLDRLGVPADAGRTIASKALRDAGIRASTADISAAVKRRKLSGDQIGQETMPGTEPVQNAPDRSGQPYAL